MTSAAGDAAVAVVQDYWQPKMSNLVQRTSYLFNNPEMSDVSFIFKWDQEKYKPVKIYGHKFILGMCSPILYKMFYDNKFPNSNETENNEIQMSDVPFDGLAFQNFIKFLYTDKIEWTKLSVETIIGILHCSEFYDVPVLKTESGKALLARLKIDNVILILETAQLLNDKVLTEKCWEIVDSGAKTMFESKTILEAKMETLFQIIRRDNLVVNESQVLDVCLKWSEKECERKGQDPCEENKRQVLDKVYFQIRFPLLPPLKIAELVGSNFLTQKESLDMFLHMHCASDTTLDKSKCVIPKSPFIMKKRAEVRKKLTAVRSQKTQTPSILNDLDILFRNAVRR